MRLAQDNDVVHTLTPDRSDQPFSKSLLPGRAGGVGLRDETAIDPIAIADEVVRSLLPNVEGLGDEKIARTMQIGDQNPC